ncbi:MAG: ACT domain-containing protein [bacterium]|nr:ACT domain-containing protein [bacterium]
MRAVITVVGKDCVGILAEISQACKRYNINIVEVSQTVLQDMFCMIMMCDISTISIKFSDFSEQMSLVGKKMNISVHVMHEDIFNSMHRI